MPVNEKHGLNMIILPECVSRVGNLSADGGMLHEEIEIKCFYEGESTLLIGNETLTVSTGDVVVINPYEFHTTLASPEAKGKYHLFMIPLDFFSGMGIDELDLRSELLLKKRSLKTLFKSNERMVQILTRITEEYKERPAAYRVAIRGLITEFFAILMRFGLSTGECGEKSRDILRQYKLIEPALHHIRENYSDEITVDRLTSLCNVTKHYFCRVFKAVTGKTAMEYLRDYRLELSNIMLGNTDRSICEVAELCGFEDANYFCRCYKARYGIPPGKSRNQRINK